jgi:hypothetical protein
MQSSDSANQKEGMKGVKDDSIGVRLGLLRFIASEPKAPYREAARIAVTDRSPRVVAAALEAFAVLPGPVTPDELGAAASEPHPLIELALLDLAKKKDFKISDDMMKQIRNSPDPVIQRALDH